MQKPQPATFYIVRHGQTPWNVARKIQGQTDIDLTQEGERQAQETADLLKEIHFDEAFSSDLLRAKRTADIIIQERKLALKTTEVLRERKFGRLEGKYFTDLQELDEMLEKLEDEKRFVYKEDDDMESDEQLMGRFITFLREAAVAYAGKTVLIVSHGTLMRIFLIHIGYGTYQTFGHDKKLRNSSYIKLESDGIEFKVVETYGIDAPDLSSA